MFLLGINLDHVIEPEICSDRLPRQIEKSEKYMGISIFAVLQFVSLPGDVETIPNLRSLGERGIVIFWIDWL